MISLAVSVMARIQLLKIAICLLDQAQDDRRNGKYP